MIFRIIIILNALQRVLNQIRYRYKLVQLFSSYYFICIRNSIKKFFCPLAIVYRFKICWLYNVNLKTFKNHLCGEKYIFRNMALLNVSDFVRENFVKQHLMCLYVNNVLNPLYNIPMCQLQWLYYLTIVFNDEVRRHCSHSS